MAEPTEPSLRLGQAMQEHRDYWLGILSKDLARAELLVDGRRPAGFGPAERVERVQVEIAGPLLRDLRRLVGGGSPLAQLAVLIAGLAASLRRYSGSSGSPRVLLGTPALVEHAEENAVVVALETPALEAPTLDKVRSSSFGDLLVSARDSLIAAYRHQAYPIATLARELEVEASEGRCPFFDILVRVEGLHGTAPELGHHITLEVSDRDERLELAFTFCPSLFRARSIDLFAHHLVRTLAQGLADVATPLAELTGIDVAERARLAGLGRGEKSAVVPESGGVHELFEECVRRHPDASAVRCGETVLSYSELDRRANRIAHELIELGVGAELLVGVCMERSWQLPAAILGIHKAGGACLAMDPDYPAGRLELMIEEAQPLLLLTEAAIAESLPKGDCETVLFDVLLGRGESRVRRCPSSAPPSEVSGGQLAYCLFTSGTTGRPKGVLIEHRALVHYLAQRCAAFPLTAFPHSGADRVLHHTSLGFDMSVAEIYGALSTGAELIVAPPQAHRDLDLLVDAIVDSGVTVLQSTPTLLELLLERPRWPECASLRLVLSLGEPLPVALAERFLERSRARLVNTYGPTEATIDVTSVPYQSAEHPRVAPLGAPHPNTEIRLLDERLEVVPQGAPGELYIGGPQLARGYLNAPALSAERFVPDPFASGGGGARLYRTGDLARFGPDGEIEFLGRVDDQIKLRGHRIELAEIENVLAEHEGVRRCHVMAQPLRSGELGLVAWVVGDSGLMPELRVLAEFRLTEVMRPAEYVFLESLPRLPSGKVDKARLPAPGQGRPQTSAPFVAPRDPVEQRLAPIWQEVLGVDLVGVDDNFFELGGDSILTLLIASRASDEGLALSPRLIYEHQTIGALARALGDAAAASAPQDPVDGPEPPTVVQPSTGDSTIADPYALTPLQQGMLFHSVSVTTPGLYLVQTCWTLRGDLDVERLVTAWRLVVDRQPAMRTAFEWEDLEHPVQVVHRAVELPLQQLDWRQLSETEESTSIKRLLEKDRQCGFDLASPPLHRITLVRLAERRWHLLWTYHQAALDGWSCSLVQSEVAAAYDAGATAASQATSPPPLFRDYITWLECQSTELAERFWRARLSGFAEATGIQPKREAHGEAEPLFAATRREERRTLGGDVTGELTAALREARFTLSTLIHAAWALVLSRRSGSRDVVFGSVVSGRPPMLRGVESMVGFFINTIPVRARPPADDTSLRSWLQTLQNELLEAGELGHCSLIDIQGWSEVPRGRPLLESVVAFENYPIDDPERGWGGDTEVIDFFALEKLNYPIALFAGVLEEGLTLRALYDDEHLEPSTVQWVLEELETILRQAAEDLDRPVANLDLLSPAERQRLLIDWNDTSAEFPPDETFTPLFERQVARTPKRRAVVCGDDSLTFAELNARANGAAAALAALGSRPGEIVGVLADRSIDFLIAILAAFKSGGSYLPLDPRAPAARLTTTLERAGISRVLHSERYASVCAEASEGMSGGRPNLVALTYVTGAPPLGDNPRACARPDDLAYVIFTSGSTGMPKGAMVEQRGMVNHLFAKIADLGIGAEDRIAQNASQCFDISVWQFLAALLVGGETHIYTDEINYDPRALLDAVERDGLTLLETVPSLLRPLLEVRDDPIDARRNPRVETLRCLIPTGEALPPELAAWWLERFPHVDLLNAYGPTECSDDVTHHRLEADSPREHRRIPLGRPVANTRLYILDEEMQPQPIGTQGELYVGGVGVGRGYVNDPAKTAQCFLPDPFSREGGARLYRTGDLARYRSDGVIDFLGRIDHQVKIRGFRIELGDIEAALAEHADLAQCVVLVDDTPAGDQRLIAYFTAPRQAPSLTELRDHLAARLPAYMVPQTFVPLPVLPLNANGKLDRKALPTPGEEQLTPTGDFMPARTEVEKRIAQLWQEVLGLERVGLHDNFFDLGGHSLLLLRVLESLRHRHSDLEIVDLFHHPTVRSLARFLDGEPSSTSDRSEERDRRAGQRRAARRRQLERRQRAQEDP